MPQLRCRSGSAPRARPFAAVALALAIAASGSGQPTAESEAYWNPRLRRGATAPDAPQPIFYAPLPPPLDRAIGRSQTAVPPFPAPAELSHYVCDSFYPQLGTRLADLSLPPETRRALDQYRAARQALVAELRGEIDRFPDSDPAGRREAFAALARKQAAPLAELEAAAARLRSEIARNTRDWGELRDWRLGAKEPRGFSPLELALVMRGYAFYQPHLLPAQRTLLREVALDLNQAVEEADKGKLGPYVFFHPELARIEFPAELPPAAARKLAEYQTLRSQLKQELFETVRASDGAPLATLRTPFRALADKQAARLQALESLAEDVRRELPPEFVRGGAPERSPLPVAQAEKLAGLLAARAEAERTAVVKLNAVIKASPVRIAVRHQFDDAGMKFAVGPHPRSRRETPAVLREAVEKAHVALSAIAEEYGRRLVELINELDALKREAGETLGTNDGKTIDHALTVANRVFVRRASDDAYRYYRIATLEPGLSPAQRRLLFDSAVQQLDLPLPAGELQPTRRTETW